MNGSIPLDQLYIMRINSLHTLNVNDLEIEALRMISSGETS
jgi:hypothetical protein